MIVIGDLPAMSMPPDYYRLVVPALDWLTSNDRGAWTKHHKLISKWRTVTAWWATTAGLPTLNRAYICAELRFTNTRVRDAANWHLTAKACVDGLVDAGVLPDDRDERLIGPDMRIGPKSPEAQLILHIWRL
jgi:hypothetical protein